MAGQDFNFSASPGLDFPNPTAEQGMAPQASIDLRSRHRAVEAAAQVGGGRMPQQQPGGYRPAPTAAPIPAPVFAPGQSQGAVPNLASPMYTDIPIPGYQGEASPPYYNAAIGVAQPGAPQAQVAQNAPPDDLADILGSGTDAEEEVLPSNNVDAARSKLNELKDSLGEKKSSKAVGITVIIFILLLLAFLGIGSLRDKSTQKQIEAVRAPYTEFSPETVDVSKVSYTDSVKISKLARVENGAMQCYFTGKPKDFGQQILIPVTSAVYQAVNKGDTVKITYQIITLRTDGETTDYVINAKVMTK